MELTATEAASRQRRALRVSRLYDRPTRRDRWAMETYKQEEKLEQECGEFPEWIKHCI
jgi:hypothetical protein